MPTSAPTASEKYVPEAPKTIAVPVQSETCAVMMLVTRRLSISAASVPIITRMPSVPSHCPAIRVVHEPIAKPNSAIGAPTTASISSQRWRAVSRRDRSSLSATRVAAVIAIASRARTAESSGGMLNVAMPVSTSAPAMAGASRTQFGSIRSRSPSLRPDRLRGSERAVRAGRGGDWAGCPAPLSRGLSASSPGAAARSRTTGVRGAAAGWRAGVATIGKRPWAAAFEKTLNLPSLSAVRHHSEGAGAWLVKHCQPVHDRGNDKAEEPR